MHQHPCHAHCCSHSSCLCTSGPPKGSTLCHHTLLPSKDSALVGINQYESNKPARYVNNTNLSSRVANLNPPWNGDQSEQASNAQFQKAMQLTGLEFMEALEYYSKVSVCQAYIVLGHFCLPCKQSSFSCHWGAIRQVLHQSMYIAMQAPCAQDCAACLLLL